MKRLFICDPMCILPFGHNVSSLVYFRQYLKDYFAEVYCLAARRLSRSLATDKEIVPFFHYYYDAFIPVLPTAEQEHLPAPSLLADPLEHVAHADMVALFKHYNIASDDSIFFPSADFYGLVGIIQVLESLSPKRSPRVFFRFIGVMESASKLYKDPMQELFSRIERLLSAGYDIRLSAETPPYADHIALKLQTSVHVTPYPASSQFIPAGPKSPFLVYSAGSARRDKGFFELFQIISALRAQYIGLDIQFIMQTLPDRDIVHERHYMSQLYALPGVQLLSATITDTLMMDVYSRSHVVLLPYEAHIYRYRGSAVTMEAASVGRPILTVPETGFASQVSYYGLGQLCRTTQDFVDGILEYFLMSVDEINLKCQQARNRFLVDIDGAFRSWMR